MPGCPVVTDGSQGDRLIGHVTGTFTAPEAARVVVSDPSLTSRIVSRDGCAVAAVPRLFRIMLPWKAQGLPFRRRRASNAIHPAPLRISACPCVSSIS